MVRARIAAGTDRYRIPRLRGHRFASTARPDHTETLRPLSLPVESSSTNLPHAGQGEPLQTIVPPPNFPARPPLSTSSNHAPAGSTSG